LANDNFEIDPRSSHLLTRTSGFFMTCVMGACVLLCLGSLGSSFVS
jgi:hypothetical protein